MIFIMGIPTLVRWHLFVEVPSTPPSLPIPHSKVQGANMGPTWVLSAPGGHHVGLMNLVLWDPNPSSWDWFQTSDQYHKVQKIILSSLIATWWCINMCITWITTGSDNDCLGSIPCEAITWPTETVQCPSQMPQLGGMPTPLPMITDMVVRRHASNINPLLTWILNSCDLN